MPRTTHPAMLAALADVQDGTRTQTEAARHHGVSPQGLHHHVNKLRSAPDTATDEQRRAANIQVEVPAHLQEVAELVQ